MIATIPTMRGIIDRRMLVNFRLNPGIARGLVPPPFRLKLVDGWAMAGICLIRLKDIRPRGVPAMFGLTSENAAHRIAVEWDEGGATREGVYIPRRDTSSRLQSFAGDRVFPGIYHHANFEVNEHAGEFELRMRAHDGSATISVRAKIASELSATSVFPSLASASEFFARGSAGYSATANPSCCDGIELHTRRWEVEPLEIRTVESSFFDDPVRFPAGSIHFDCALLMRNIEHEWRALPRLERFA